MRVLVIVTDDTSELLKEALLNWVRKRKSISKKNVTIEVVSVNEESNPSAIAERADAAYSISGVADVIKTSEAIADWGREWRLVSTTPTMLFVYEKQRVMPRRAMGSTRPRATTGPRFSQLRSDLSNHHEV